VDGDGVVDIRANAVSFQNPLNCVAGPLPFGWSAQRVLVVDDVDTRGVAMRTAGLREMAVA
jgi:hypothetical protein